MFVSIKQSDSTTNSTVINIQSHQQRNIATYTKLEIIGKGTYGTVYKAIDNLNQNNRLCAIKKISKIIIPQQGISRSLYRQLGILKSLQHKNIIKLIDYNSTESNEHAFLVFEYIQSDLEKEIFKRKHTDFNKNSFDENQEFIMKNNKSQVLKNTWKIIKGILQGINYCHSRQIFHRDLKPSNILIDSQFENIKIADFGIARQFYNTQRQYTYDIGTIYYRAPQCMFKKREYGPAIDIWAIGLIMFESLIGQALLKKYQNPQLPILSVMNAFGYQYCIDQNCLGDFDVLLTSIKYNETKQTHRIENKIPELNILDKNGLDLLNGLLTLDPKKRITASQALKSQYFTGNLQFYDKNIISE